MPGIIPATRDCLAAAFMARKFSRRACQPRFWNPPALNLQGLLSIIYLRYFRLRLIYLAGEGGRI